MPATYTKFEAASEEILKGTHDFDAHTFKVYLTNAAPDAAADAVKADLAEISAGAGYSAGGVATTLSITRSGGTSKVAGTDVTITASGGAIGPFRYVVLYNDTSASDNLISYWDYGSAITLQDGESLTVDFNPSTGIFTLV